MRAACHVGLFLLFWGLAYAAASTCPADPDEKDDQEARKFEVRVSETLAKLRALLNETKSIQLAQEQEHTYDDKFSLVEFVTLQAWQSLSDAFPMIGVNLTEVAIEAGAASSKVFLEFQGQTKCELLSQQEVEVRGDGIEVSDGDGMVTSTYRNLHKVTEYLWQVTESYGLQLCHDECEEEGGKTTLKERTISTTVTTTTKHTPTKTRCPRALEPPPLDITWLVRDHFSVSAEDRQGSFHFKIDRNAEACKTPRRNPDVERLFTLHERLFVWLTDVQKYFQSLYVPPDPAGKHAYISRLDESKEEAGWHSTVPLFENATLLTAHRVGLLRAKQQEALRRKLNRAASLFENSAMASTQEASIYIFLGHAADVLWIHQQSVQKVERMLRDQLVQAIGKYIGPDDFRHYMEFHTQKLFAEPFAPRPFSIAVRHGNGTTPVGSLAIEESRPCAAGRNGDPQPVQMLSRRISGLGKPPIRIPIDAATQIQLTGDRILSGWIRYEFGQSSWQAGGPGTVLAARARQFSSFILLIGTVTGPDSFEPKSGIILQNKDEVVIPILTESLPSAKEFKDAISSLSPEQQQFARSFRTMQLESSVFGICVVQLKPQLENVLNLPSGALAKEIQLTEDLTSLFINHQIPADLLSFDGDSGLNATSRVAEVKGHVRAVNDIIQNLKQEALIASKQKAKATEFMARSAVHMDAAPVVTMYAAAAYADEATTAESASQHLRPSAAPSVAPSADTGGKAPPSTLEQARYEDSQDESESFDEESTSVNEAKVENVVNEAKVENIEKATKPGDRLDFTEIPRTLDARLEEHDTDGYLRSMTIKSGETWNMKRKANLLVDAVSSTLTAPAVRREKLEAFDLLDAISRSGSLPIQASELHVVVGVSHNFVNSVMKTLCVDNINPIEKAEQSLILLSSELMDYDGDTRNLIRSNSDRDRLAKSFPNLFMSA